MNGMNNDWLPVEAEANQSWPPKKRNWQTNKQRKTETEKEKEKKLDQMICLTTYSGYLLEGHL